MKRFSTITMILFLAVMTMAAQKNRKRISAEVPVDSMELRMKAYADSLRQYKLLVDSLTRVNEANGTLSKLSAKDLDYRLFSPLTYYPDVTEGLFEGKQSATDGVGQEVSGALFNTYMNRPDLVQTTVSKLHQSASRSEENTLGQVQRKVMISKDIVKEEKPIDEQAPVELVVYKPNFWKFSGDYSLQFLQNYLSDNWYQSGESNLAMTGMVTLQANYNNKQKIKFENKLEMKLGFQTSESDTIHKLKTSSDLLRYTGKLGIQATKKWYYTLQGIVTTQFAYGLKSNDRNIYSDFFSPITVNLSVGMDYNIDIWNGKLTGSAHLAPFAYNWKHVSRLDLAKRNGIDEGHHSLQDYGSQFTINALWKPNDKIKWNSRMYAYTTYHRVEFQWENTISFAFSKYISTTLFLYPRFDDSRLVKDSNTYWQFKEYFSLGFNYSM